jgi:hypothetical protein
MAVPERVTKGQHGHELSSRGNTLMTRQSKPAGLYVLTMICCIICRATQAASVDLPNELPSMVGGGLGSTTDYAGGRTASLASCQV